MKLIHPNRTLGYTFCWSPCVSPFSLYLKIILAPFDCGARWEMAQGGIWVMCGCKRKGRGLFPVAEHNLDLQLCSEVRLISPLDTAVWICPAQSSTELSSLKTLTKTAVARSCFTSSDTGTWRYCKQSWTWRCDSDNEIAIWHLVWLVLMIIVGDLT